MASRDLSDFDESVLELLDTLREVLEVHDERNLNLSSKKNPILTRLQSYSKTYDKTDPEDHVNYFQDIYSKYRIAILRGPRRDGWLNDNSIIIQWGSDVGIKNNIKIHLSSIYSNACSIRDEIEELNTLPNMKKSKELQFPSRILLSLYRIFAELTPSKKDREKLSKHVNTLKKELGERSSLSGGGDNPLGGLFDMATGLMDQMGIKLPEGQQMPDKDQFGDAIGKMLNNPQAKTMMGSVMKEMQECENMSDVAQKLLSGLGGLAAEKESIGENVNVALQGMTPTEAAEECEEFSEEV